MFDNSAFNLGHLDTLAYSDTVIHRLDPRAKLLATLAFIITVVSFPKYELAGLMPFFMFPVLILALGGIPAKFILKKVFVVSSFALFIGIFNPLIDRQTVLIIRGLPISGGWISFASIMLKFLLTASSALLLIATTSFPGICHALQRLGVPDIFVTQLLFLYRYLFVLVEETMRVVRARDTRSFGRRGLGIRPFIGLAGTLFIRTIERAERVYRAMLSRGFTGRVHAAAPFSFSTVDALFLVLTVSFFVLFRSLDVVETLGKFSMTIMLQP